MASNDNDDVKAHRVLTEPALREIAARVFHGAPADAIFDPRTGKIQQAKDLSGTGALEVRVPYPSGLASIELQEQVSGRVGIASANALKRINRNEIEALVEADATARSRISPMAVETSTSVKPERLARRNDADAIFIRCAGWRGSSHTACRRCGR